MIYSINFPFASQVEATSPWEMAVDDGDTSLVAGEDGGGGYCNEESTQEEEADEVKISKESKEEIQSEGLLYPAEL